MSSIKSYKPGRKWFKTIVCKVVMVILGRAFQVFSRHDHEIKNEIAAWPEGFTLELNVLPFGPRLLILKEDGKIRTVGEIDEKPELSVNFKNIESAFLILTPLMGVPRGFAEHRFIVIGDVAKAMAFTRCLNRILAYLYPDFLCRNLMRRIPEINFMKRMSKRLYFYTIGIVTGS
ncbi:MAG: hypothetical protein H6680_01925 [Desulfobacteraceae bacterium]|nr:hypothetical protein [Desulfobacteraceae bacterium]